MKSKNNNIPEENDSFSADFNPHSQKFNSFGENVQDNIREEQKRGSKSKHRKEGSHDQRDSKAVEDSSVNIKEALS